MGRSEKVKLAKPNGKREKGKEWWQLLASYSTIISNQTMRKQARTNEMNRNNFLVGLTPQSPIHQIHIWHPAVTVKWRKALLEAVPLRSRTIAKGISKEKRNYFRTISLLEQRSRVPNGFKAYPSRAFEHPMTAEHIWAVMSSELLEKQRWGSDFERCADSKQDRAEISSAQWLPRQAEQ